MRRRGLPQRGRRRPRRAPDPGRGPVRQRGRALRTGRLTGRGDVARPIGRSRHGSRCRAPACAPATAARSSCANGPAAARSRPSGRSARCSPPRRPRGADRRLRRRRAARDRAPALRRRRRLPARARRSPPVLRRQRVDRPLLRAAPPADRRGAVAATRPEGLPVRARGPGPRRRRALGRAATRATHVLGGAGGPARPAAAPRRRRRRRPWRSLGARSPGSIARCACAAACTPTTSTRGVGSTGTLWTYNQGAPVGAHLLLHRATGDEVALRAGAGHGASRRSDGSAPIARGSTRRSFNAVWFRNLLALDAVGPRRRARPRPRRLPRARLARGPRRRRPVHAGGIGSLRRHARDRCRRDWCSCSRCGRGRGDRRRWSARRLRGTRSTSHAPDARRVLAGAQRLERLASGRRRRRGSRRRRRRATRSTISAVASGWNCTSRCGPSVYAWGPFGVAAITVAPGGGRTCRRAT